VVKPLSAAGIADVVSDFADEGVVPAIANAVAAGMREPLLGTGMRREVRLKSSGD
jgi:hypothetical protein